MKTDLSLDRYRIQALLRAVGVDPAVVILNDNFDITAEPDGGIAIHFDELTGTVEFDNIPKRPRVIRLRVESARVIEPPFEPGTRIAIDGPMLEREPPRNFVTGLHRQHRDWTLGVLLVGCPDCAGIIQEAINTGGWKPA